MQKKISIIIPVYNEGENVSVFYNELNKVLNNKFDYEIIFIDDGSTDQSAKIIENLASSNPRIKYIEFSRNFGKEVALTAGLNNCSGNAAITIDADLQHPVKLIPDFISKWENGAKVVVGVRKKNKSDTLSKRIGSWSFYKIMSRIADTKIIPNSTDYRLLDRQVINEFNRCTERQRMARGLIDWLGFRQTYIYFDAGNRQDGKPGYSFTKLIKLALSSFVSLSLVPLKLAGYLGIFIILCSAVFGIYMIITDYLLNIQDFSGPAILATINLFLIGIVLSCLGLIALYIANIQIEALNRPMYIINKEKL